jgi:hypothetical protein
MALKVIHINRKELSRETEVKAFWENVLKPKWEKRSRERAEKLLIDLEANGNTSPKEFTIQNETVEPSKKLEIVIEVNGNKLIIKCSSKNSDKKQSPKL